MSTYKIIRMYADPSNTNKVIATGLSLEEAQAHCRRDDTRGGGWFDGYDIEKPTPEEQEERDNDDIRLRNAVAALKGLGI